MNSKMEAKATAKRMGAKVTVERPRALAYDIEIEAPAGQRWRFDLKHSIVESGVGNEAQAWADVLEQMSHGVEKCDEADCEWCEDAE
jgi:hypothetical protein